MAEDKLTGLEIGKPYTFKFLDRTLTGVLVRISGKNRWCTFRARTGSWSVPPQDVIGPADA